MDAWAETTCWARKATASTRSCAARATIFESSCELSYGFFFSGCSKPSRQRKRGQLHLAVGSCVRLRPEYKNHVGPYDFVHERTHDNWPLRILTVIEEFSRESLAIDPVIGHMKNDGRLGRNHLLVKEDDRVKNTFIFSKSPKNRVFQGRLLLYPEPAEGLLLRQAQHGRREKQRLVRLFRQSTERKPWR